MACNYQRVQEFLAHSKALVLIIDPSSDKPPDAATIRDLFGLTSGEARVAALVGASHSPKRAAERLQLGEATVRTVL